jgi:hypothetical protein
MKKAVLKNIKKLLIKMSDLFEKMKDVERLFNMF